MTLITLTVITAVAGWFGSMRQRDSFEALTTSDNPMLINLLHVDRDLADAQLMLEQAVTSGSSSDKSDLIEGFHNHATSATASWDLYSRIPKRDESSRPDETRFLEGRSAWLTSAESVVSELDAGRIGRFTDAAAKIELTRRNVAFARDALERLEENIAEPRIEVTVADVRDINGKTVAGMLLLAAIVIIAGGGILVFTYRTARNQFLDSEARRAESEIETSRIEFESGLAQAFDLAQSEVSATSTVQQVLSEIVGGRATEFLVADSSVAHLYLATSTRQEAIEPMCPAASPSDCPAIRRGTTMTFADGSSYTACPNLRNRPGGPCSAACVPVSIAGRSVAVLHSVGPNLELPSATDLERMSQIADRVGDRIGVLRAFAQSQAQASTDPLTGLLNRRSFQDKAAMMINTGQRVAVAFGDLDHFKTLNDTHGHEAGDRALRLFSRVVKEAMRSNDLAARWGGEEFVLVFHGSDSSTASAALERLRESLTVALATGTTPPFTVSFGVADSDMSQDIGELVNLADDALLQAKRTGRDKIVTADPSGSVVGGEASEPAEV